jgi:hypothetical protein
MNPNDTQDWQGLGGYVDKDTLARQFDNLFPQSVGI